MIKALAKRTSSFGRLDRLLEYPPIPQKGKSGKRGSGKEIKALLCVIYLAIYIYILYNKKSKHESRKY